MPGFSASATPDGGSLHYQLIKAPDSHLDMQLRNVDSAGSPSYFFHITQEGDAAPEHATLHHGQSLNDPIVLASTYKAATEGEIITKSSDTPAIAWVGVKNAIYTQLIVQGRTLRWYKTYHQKHAIPLIRRAHGYIEWLLQDVTDVPADQAKSLSTPVGNTIATLKLESANQHLLAKGIQEDKETGNFVWITPQDQHLQDVATMLFLTLWHRDRQINNSEPLGPKVDVTTVRRTAGARNPGGMATLGTTSTLAGAY
ncbi:hypothetical protein K461DRAFT_269336 [Myriangium duriaei CBS 260.36]|uniref:Uncharacterized protein n=1 Tax=Myriangium duriaei CBS 260.36 TaxID=1168546 RepID=A0A9P4IY45_9PEZI|nr:hypothetical protein K461DRAFT_269336 [Myriangium duriaei CBS 260.36]